MKYSKAKNIWSMTAAEVSMMQPGQWVYADRREDSGQFLGIKPSGTIVVAWRQNRLAQENGIQYIRNLRRYALGA
jgi:hypothetical protein